MRVLIVKTSSLGDIVHAFPAVTEAAHAVPDIEFDWVAEEPFSEVPAWHPAVDRVIPVAIRRWRCAPLAAFRNGQYAAFRQQLLARDYDLVLDSQGLIKSALVARCAKAPVAGFDIASTRESLAALFYGRTYRVPQDKHAVIRQKMLFAQALGYETTNAVEYGLDRTGAQRSGNELLFLHGTTWPSKRWPLAFWRSVARLALDHGFNVTIAAGNEDEADFSKAIADGERTISLLTGLSLNELANRIQGTAGVIAVDSGLAHIATAYGVPVVALYGASSAELTGVLGSRQQALSVNYPCAPCRRRRCRYEQSAEIVPPCSETLDATAVWTALQALSAK